MIHGIGIGDIAVAVAVLVVLGIVALVAWLRIRHRHQRVCQRARLGSKAVIVRLSTGYQQDTWFEGNWPHAGSIVLLRGSTGWGPHNNNPDAFHVGPDQLLSLLRPGTMAAAQRRHLRQAKRVGR